MKRDLSRLQQEYFDVIIIGGGIIGAGIARDAALRGLHILLVEKDDFACGTTSSSTRLIHGGLRYLRTRQFKLVRQDLREREILLDIAPHLVHRLEFIIPLPGSQPFYRFGLPLGLYLYDLLARGHRLPRWQRFSRSETLAKEPELAEIRDLAGAYLYYDCQAELVERLCLENVISAAEKDACILNHAAAGRLLTDGSRLQGIEVEDILTGKKYAARGQTVINAAGHWADLVWREFGISGTDALRKTKGIHLLVRKLSNRALVLFAQSDRRLFFVIPWLDYSLIGTTDTDFFNDPDVVYAEAADVNYLVTEMQHYFPQFSRDDIFYTTAGLRPLVAASNKAASDTSRSHKILDHGSGQGIKGLITVLGGKITAYRAIAEEVVDLVCHKLERRSSCVTAVTPLPGAPAVQPQEIEKSAREYSISVENAANLASVYGSRFYSVLDYLPGNRRLGQAISSGGKDILAQIRYAVEEEEALTVADFMMRRSSIGLGPSQGLDSVEKIAEEMGLLLGWSSAEKERQINDYRALAASRQRYRLEVEGKVFYNI